MLLIKRKTKMFYYISLLVLVPKSVSIATAASSPSYLPWSEPCFPRSSSGHFNFDLSMEIMIHSLLTDISEAIDSAQTLKESVLQQRLQSRILARVCEGRNILPLSDEDISTTKRDDIGSILKNGYRKLSLLLVFLELTKNDSIKLGKQDDIVNNIYDLENKIYGVLCDMTMMLYKLDLTLEYHVTRNDIHVKQREITSFAVIAIRDYGIINDGVKLLRALKNGCVKVDSYSWRQ